MKREYLHTYTYKIHILRICYFIHIKFNPFSVLLQIIIISAIFDNQRYTQEKIQNETMAIASQWEKKLFQEMTRLTNELNQINGEERQEAVEKIKREYTQELDNMKETYGRVQNQLREEVHSLRVTVASKSRELEEVQQIADNQVIQTRMYLEHRENDHQLAMDRAAEEREKALGVFYECNST